MVKIPLFSRYFGSNVLIEMKDFYNNSDRVDIDYIYMAFKERFLQELAAEGYKIVKVDESQREE